MMFDATKFRADFPALGTGQIYFDTAATALKPQPMITATADYYSQYTANAYRSLHHQAQRTSQNIEATRQMVAEFIHAASAQQIIWTKGATESVNLVAQSYARHKLKAGDEIIVSELEHHSNLIPWLIVAEQTGAKVIKWAVNTDHQLDIVGLKQCITHKTKIVAVTQMSNVSGYQPDLVEIVQLVHENNAIIVVDGAQGVIHSPIDVTTLDIDFYLFSAHKFYGPTGLGVLYVKSDLLSQLAVWHGGGKMLKSASFNDFIPQSAPEKFEAGTLNIADIIGFGATLNWLKQWDLLAAESYTLSLIQQVEQDLKSITGFISYRATNSPLLSFNIENIHHSDIAVLLAEQNVAVRTGELCAQPLMKRLNCTGVIRASFAPYNNQQDILQLVNAIHNALDILR